jgi:aryl-alcohol dehydrogenase-like predicted oxidoreductase
MRYRRLGNSGLRLSEIGLGGWLTFGHVHDEIIMPVTFSYDYK